MRADRAARTMVVGSIALGIMLLAGLVLFLLLVLRPPGTEMRLAVGPPAAEPCPVESGGTACYRFDVVNTGDADGVATCTTTPASGTDAVFANGADAVGVRLQGGETKGVYVRVTPSAGSDQVSAPSLNCQA